MLKLLNGRFWMVEIQNASYSINKNHVVHMVLLNLLFSENLANEYNGMVIGTGDMSELALGWATYNGDHMSMYGVRNFLKIIMLLTLLSTLLHRHHLAFVDLLLEKVK